MPESPSMTLTNCSMISQASIFTDFVSEQKSFSARAAALLIQFDKLKERESEFVKEDLDLVNELTEYNTARETFMNDIRNWYDKLGMQISRTSKDEEERLNRSNRTHKVIRLLKKKISMTSPLGVDERETKKNRLWLSEEQSSFPPEMMKTIDAENEGTQSTGRYQLRSMKKSITNAFASPFRGIRSSTPDAPKENRGNKKEVVDEAFQKPEDDDQEEDDEDDSDDSAEEDASPEENAPAKEKRTEDRTINISSGWPTLIALQEQEKGNGKEAGEEAEKSVLELEEEEKEILRQAGVMDLFDQCVEVQKKASEEKKLLEKREKEAREAFQKKEAECADTRKERILVKIQRSIDHTRQMQQGLEKRKKALEETEKTTGGEKKQVTIKTKQNTLEKTQNTHGTTNKTRQNTNKTNPTQVRKQDPDSPSKKDRIRAEKSAAKMAAKTAAAEAAKAAKEAAKQAEEAAAELKEIEEMDSDDENEDEGWRVAMGKKKAKKLRKMSAENSSEESSDADSPPPKRRPEEKKQKTLKDIQLESLVRSRMIEMRPRNENEKFGDDGKINYFAFKNKFQSLTNVEGCNPFDALSEITYWVKGNAVRIAEAYQGSDDPVQALKDLWIEFDMFYDLNSQTPLERVAPILEKQPIRKEDLDGHMELLADLKAIKREAEQTNSQAELDGHNIVRDIVNKRLAHMSDRFFDQESEKRLKDRNFRMKFDDLIREVSKRAQTLKAQGKTSKATHTYTPRVAVTKVLDSPARHCYLCSASHPMDKCNRLAKMTIDERVGYLRKEKICFRCFEKDHLMKDCPSKIILKCDQCTYKHHPILHGLHLVQKKLSEQRAAAIEAADALANANKDMNGNGGNSGHQITRQNPPPLMTQNPRNI